MLSPELEEKLDKSCWYHGTEQNFNSWKFPPPPKPGENLLVPHTAVFFTSDLDFAKGAGGKIAVASLSSRSNILDATVNYDASEELRKLVIKNQIASLTLNCQHDYWHQGWKTGDVLRMAFTDIRLNEHINKLTHYESQRLGLPLEQASTLVQLNTARGLIELICVSAKKLGFDALYGHEVDRHSNEGEVIAQPWLAVFSNGVVTEPEWV